MTSEMKFMLGLDKFIHKNISLLHPVRTEEANEMLSVKRASQNTNSRALLGL